MELCLYGFKHSYGYRYFSCRHFYLLVEKLQSLMDKQLKDIIADYGTDPSKLAMKWKDRERFINHIVDTARRRAAKGDANREKTDNDANNG